MEVCTLLSLQIIYLRSDFPLGHWQQLLICIVPLKYLSQTESKTSYLTVLSGYLPEASALDQLKEIVQSFLEISLFDFFPRVRWENQCNSHMCCDLNIRSVCWIHVMLQPGGSKKPANMETACSLTNIFLLATKPLKGHGQIHVFFLACTRYYLVHTKKSFWEKSLLRTSKYFMHTSRATTL